MAARLARLPTPKPGDRARELARAATWLADALDADASQLCGVDPRVDERIEAALRVLRGAETNQDRTRLVSEAVRRSAAAFRAFVDDRQGEDRERFFASAVTAAISEVRRADPALGRELAKRRKLVSAVVDAYARAVGGRGRAGPTDPSAKLRALLGALSLPASKRRRKPLPP